MKIRNVHVVLAAFFLISSLIFYFYFFSLGATRIPCDQSTWEVRKEFDPIAWQEGRDREKFVSVLLASLPGKTREYVKANLGSPANDPVAEPDYYRYLIGGYDFMRCDMAISMWLVIYFDEQSKATSVSLNKNH